jgi:hypothetical protein
MKAEETRRGGAWIARERGANEIEPPTESIMPPKPPATAPLFEHARIHPGAVLVMATVCEVSITEFVHRYA